MKAIIPAAGLGTRLLPVTKVVPKELLLVEGKPAIQWVLEEAANAGIQEAIVVISPYKTILRDYLTPLESKHPLAGHPGLNGLEQLLQKVKLTFVEQAQPKGLGDAILTCQDLIGEESFVLMLPDNICALDSELLKRLMEIYIRDGKSCVALYAACGPGLRYGAFIVEPRCDSVFKVCRVLPKGAPEGESSKLRGIGRCIFGKVAFDYLELAHMDGGMDDDPFLDALARDGLLLGALSTDNFYHLGMDARWRELSSIDQKGV